MVPNCTRISAVYSWWIDLKTGTKLITGRIGDQGGFLLDLSRLGRVNICMLMVLRLLSKILQPFFSSFCWSRTGCLLPRSLRLLLSSSLTEGRNLLHSLKLNSTEFDVVFAFSWKLRAFGPCAGLSKLQNIRVCAVRFLFILFDSFCTVVVFFRNDFPTRPTHN